MKAALELSPSPTRTFGSSTELQALSKPSMTPGAFIIDINTSDISITTFITDRAGAGKGETQQHDATIGAFGCVCRAGQKIMQEKWPIKLVVSKKTFLKLIKKENPQLSSKWGLVSCHGSKLKTCTSAMRCCSCCILDC